MMSIFPEISQPSLNPLTGVLLILKVKVNTLLIHITVLAETIGPQTSVCGECSCVENLRLKGNPSYINLHI